MDTGFYIDNEADGRKVTVRYFGSLIYTKSSPNLKRNLSTRTSLHCKPRLSKKILECFGRWKSISVSNALRSARSLTFAQVSAGLQVDAKGGIEPLHRNPSPYQTAAGIMIGNHAGKEQMKKSKRNVQKNVQKAKWSLTDEA